MVGFVFNNFKWQVVFKHFQHAFIAKSIIQSNTRYIHQFVKSSYSKTSKKDLATDFVRNKHR